MGAQEQRDLDEYTGKRFWFGLVCLVGAAVLGLAAWAVVTQ